MSARRATIFALSSGRPPAGIAVVRISGERAGAALDCLAGQRPKPRTARLATLRHPGTNEILDRALLLWFPGPGSATGEDVAELHLHGGRAVVDAVLQALGTVDGLREADPGEFTRRALENGRIDLNEADGLADLLAAETQDQRRAALIGVGGGVSAQIERWRTAILDVAAGVEAELDFVEEDDVSPMASETRENVGVIVHEIGSWLARAPAERLRDGIRVVIAGPPNAGKSTLLNALVGREAAIASPVAGTTRDLIEAPVVIGGIAFLLTDTAGLRASQDEVERIGVARAEAAVAAADLLIWLGDPQAAPRDKGAILVHAKADLEPRGSSPMQLGVSAVTYENLDVLISLLMARARDLLPRSDEVSLNRRQRHDLGDVLAHLRASEALSDSLLVAEEIRLALGACDRMTGKAGVEDMLDALFARFCVGK